MCELLLVVNEQEKVLCWGGNAEVQFGLSFLKYQLWCECDVWPKKMYTIVTSKSQKAEFVNTKCSWEACAKDEAGGRKLPNRNVYSQAQACLSENLSPLGHVETVLVTKLKSHGHTIHCAFPTLSIYLFLWFLLGHLKDICSTLFFIVFCFILRAAITSKPCKARTKDGRGYWHSGAVPKVPQDRNSNVGYRRLAWGCHGVFQLCWKLSS